MKNSSQYYVACSGGVDSVVLVHLMHRLGKKIKILHCNFHLRGEDSNRDERFVRNLSNSLDYPICVQSFDTKGYMQETGLNLELAARKLRYQWFNKIIKEEKAIILLGQHYDDQLETFFLQLRRGAKVKGLCGMARFNNGYFRPLLKYKKNEIYQLAQKNGWKWREDKSNTSIKYKRNWYRHEIIPFLEKNDFPIDEIVPLMQVFQKLLHHFKKEPISSSIEIEQWNTFPYWFQHYWLSEQNLSEFSPKEVMRLIKGEKGKFLENKEMKIWNEGDKLTFIPQKVPSNHLPKLEIKTVSRKEVNYASSTLFMDKDKVEIPLKVRKWQSGDFFQPYGMKGTKKVGKFLRDKKIESHKKKDVLVIVDAIGTIVGIQEFGVAETVRVDENTKEIISVKLK